MNNINIEAMTEILHEQGVTATPEQISQIVKDYDLHIDLQKESASHQFIGRKEECRECKRLKNELAEVTKERDAYHNSVKVRRSASRVWVEDGDVRYEK